MAPPATPAPVKFSAMPVIPRRRIELSSGTIVELRGLTLTDIMAIVQDLAPQFTAAFASIMAQKNAGTLTHDGIRTMLLGLIRDTPELVGRIIAAANDDLDPASVQAILGLPAVDQFLCLLVAGEETLRSEAQAKKLLAPLAAIAPMILAALPKEMLTRPAPGIGASAARRPRS